MYTDGPVLLTYLCVTYKKECGSAVYDGELGSLLSHINEIFAVKLTDNMFELNFATFPEYLLFLMWLIFVRNIWVTMLLHYLCLLKKCTFEHDKIRSYLDENSA